MWPRFRLIFRGVEREISSSLPDGDFLDSPKKDKTPFLKKRIGASISNPWLPLLFGNT
jgi:hypothetical protein